MDCCVFDEERVATCGGLTFGQPGSTARRPPLRFCASPHRLSFFKSNHPCFKPKHPCFKLKHPCFKLMHSCSKPMHSCTKPMHSCSKPMHSCSKLMHSCSKPMHSCTKLMHSCSKLMHSCSKPMHSCSKPTHSADWLTASGRVSGNSCPHLRRIAQSSKRRMRASAAGSSIGNEISHEVTRPRKDLEDLASILRALAACASHSSFLPLC